MKLEREQVVEALTENYPGAPEDGNWLVEKYNKWYLIIYTLSAEAVQEISVMVDSNDNLFIDVGSPGYVEHTTPPDGMTLPIKMWLHTHPRMNSYFSGTDMATLRVWRGMMDEAICLGRGHTEDEIVSIYTMSGAIERLKQRLEEQETPDDTAREAFFMLSASPGVW